MDIRLRSLIDEYGVFLRREAEELGYSDSAIARLVRDGEWHRVRHGAYTFKVDWTAYDDAGRYGVLCRAGLRQARIPVVLSHAGAVNEWGAPLWDLDLTTVDLTRKDGRSGRAEAGVRQHRGRLLPGDERLCNGLMVTSPTHAALELTAMYDVEHCLVVIDDLLHRGLTDLDQLKARNSLMVRWPDTLHTDLILRLADGRSESVGETRSRHLCWAQGLPAPTPQFPVLDLAGREFARVDLAWPSLGVFLEFDGRVKYQRFLREGESVTDAVLREKKREELICEVTGWRCIRIVWADLHTPAQTADRIRRLFRPQAA